MHSRKAQQMININVYGTANEMVTHKFNSVAAEIWHTKLI
jgi:hypothetical protein